MDFFLAIGWYSLLPRKITKGCSIRFINHQESPSYYLNIVLVPTVFLKKRLKARAPGLIGV
jgi:hypothetical protein